jgi:Ca2+-transporting ATPase
MQILLINIIMDGPPAQCLGVEPIHPDVLTRPPRHRDTPILTHALLLRTALSAAFVLLGCLAVFAWECQVAPGDSSRTFTAFVLFSLVNAFSCRSLDRSVCSLGLTRNKPLNISIGVALVTLAAILYTPFLSRVFQTTALSFTELAGLLALSSTLLAFDEAFKMMMNSDTKSSSRKGYIPLLGK